MLTLGSFLFFTALVAAATYLLTRGKETGTNEGYFLAGRSLTFPVIAGSLLLTNLSTEQLVGLNGGAYADGLVVMAWEVVAALSLVLMALFFLPRYLRRGVATVPQFLEQRYGASTRAACTMLFLLAYALILLPILLYTGSLWMVDALGLPAKLGVSPTAALWITVWSLGLVGSVYALVGGLRTVAVSDTLNGVGLFVGGGLLLWFALAAVNPDGPLAALDTLKTEHPGKFHSIGDDESSVPWSTLFSGVLLLNLFYWTTNQQIIQRTFGASSLAEGQKGVLLAAFIKILAPLILVLPGIAAFHLYGDTLPMEDKDKAYGMLVNDVLPRPLLGFFAAAVFGAILSSFNSALNSTATLFSLGVYKAMVNPDADDKSVIRSGVLAGAVIAVTAMCVAPLLAGQESIFTYLQAMNGLYFIPIFAVVTVGFLNRTAPGWAATAALVLGCGVIAVGYFVPPFADTGDAGVGTRVAGLIGAEIGQGGVHVLHPFHFLGVVYAGLVAFLLVCGTLFPRTVPDAVPDAAPVDMTPWKLAAPAGVALVLIVAGIYAAFAF